MTGCEYLVTYGASGAFGRFAADHTLECVRGERVVVRSLRGLEMGQVLCVATGRHQRFLSDTTIGPLIRRATDDDDRVFQEREVLAHKLFKQARDAGSEQGLPLEILDVEVLFDGKQAVFQHLVWDECELDDFIESLEREFEIAIALEDLAFAKESESEETGGCGQPGCGRADGGGCSTCGSGGCSSCGSGSVDMGDYFAHLRGKMEEHRERTALETVID